MVVIDFDLDFPELPSLRSGVHGPRTPRNLFARIALRLLALAACITLNHQLGRPSRVLADYTANPHAASTI